MNTTKQLIEQLEKESGKKVILKEAYTNKSQVMFFDWKRGKSFTTKEEHDELDKIDNIVGELFEMSYDTIAYNKSGIPYGDGTWEPGEFPENFSCLKEDWDSLGQEKQALLQKYFKIH